MRGREGERGVYITNGSKSACCKPTGKIVLMFHDSVLIIIDNAQ